MNNKNFIVPGFQFAGVAAGIKQNKNKDLGLIFSSAANTVCAGLFTTNDAKAAPVMVCKEQLKNKYTRLILVNAGNANAATGIQGIKNARACIQAAAKHYKINPKEILVSSTGKIGVPLPINKIISGLSKLEPAAESLNDFASAIMTTDQYAKVITHVGTLQNKKFHMAVVAKGAGMISPNMATFLCYIVTDLNISKAIATKLLRDASDQTLNAMTVDGDMSTNDTVLLMANGLAGNKAFTTTSKDYQIILKALQKLLEEMAILVCLDGEGATKCFKTRVLNASSKKQAKLVAESVANSQLVKTAMFGSDPNWGRILCAAGYCGAKINPDKAVIKLGNITVYKKGTPLFQNETEAKDYLKANKLVDVTIDLNLGSHTATTFASDLTYEYVRINAEYRT